ncbi:diguanylate cyclase [Roseateles violae]|uniref:Diguanylate cyclase n=1 Tax=Roseateles violae TaxID=3058042 RepID=A0ABT8DY32_9BURK|nr:diguanylate cyclase [Pelomonas sp. PFR6]MDN3922019.1 diguanylate cyclase [Pelomonas sp. PFR6]
MLLLALMVALLPLSARAAGSAAPLVLEDKIGTLQTWPAVTVLGDPGKQMGVGEALARLDQFRPPQGAYATLGLRKEAVWLHIPVEVPAGSAGRWVLDIDYPALNRIDVHVVRDGQVLQQALLGNLQPYSKRPIGSRSHALGLELKSGAKSELLLRVETSGGMIVPITLNRAAPFHARAMGEQMLQGLLTGLGFCLLLYSLAQWLSLREPLFAKYALLISGSLLFSVFQFGIGAQYLWTDNIWFELHAGGLSALIAACGSFLFIEQALSGPDSNRWFGRLMKGGAALTVLSAAMFALDLIDTHIVTAIVGSLGLAPALLGLPGAIRRQRRGDSVGGYFLVAWAAYFFFTAITVAMIKGQIGVNVWTMHSFQIGATLDMLIFMRVLGLRTVAIKAAAQQAARERDLLHSLAHTDALTGLANRRGLTTALNSALLHCAPERMVGVFLLDLNGFKGVNDSFGHEVGDELLVAVGRRLQARLHGDDLVARLGGDEFIVMCRDLQRAEQAEDLARRLSEAFETPFLVGEHQCRVGLTIGHALAPRDGLAAAELIKRADAAMYRGKKNRRLAA